jgi:two-component system chemotaxis response regulator CheY
MNKILLIDDSTLSRTILKKLIGEEYEFVEALDGMSGLEMYFLEKPDLVILDLTMPGINGLDVLGQLLSMDPDARVVIGTADIQDFSRRQAEEMGAIGFLSKPFQQREVQEMIRKVVASEDGSRGGDR